MKFKIILVLFILSMMTGVAHAGFPGFTDITKGVGNGGIGSGGRNTIDQNVEAFLKIAGDVNDLIVASSDVLFKTVATDEDIEAHNREVKAANELADPKERNAALRKIQEEELVVLANIDYAAKVKNTDQQRQQLIGASIYNFTLGVMKDRLLIDIGKKWISLEDSNQIRTTKLASVKEVIGSISSQMDSMKKIATGIKNLGVEVNLDSLPTSASDTPMLASKL